MISLDYLRLWVKAVESSRTHDPLRIIVTEDRLGAIHPTGQRPIAPAVGQLPPQKSLRLSPPRLRPGPAAPPLRALGRLVGRCRHAPLELRQAVAEDGHGPAGVIFPIDADNESTRLVGFVPANSTTSFITI